MNVQLGASYQDRVTGFKGIAVGRVEYLTGCNQVLLVPKVGADGAHRDSHWFDEQRVERDGTELVTLDNGTTPGADKPAPKY